MYFFLDFFFHLLPLPLRSYMLALPRGELKLTSKAPRRFSGADPRVL